VLLGRTKSRYHQGKAFGELVLLRHKGGWRSAQTGDEGRDASWYVFDKVATEAQRLRPLVDRPEEESEVDQGSHLMQLELECGHDAEVATTALECPQQFRVLRGRGRDNPAIGGHHLRGDQIVATETS
jgi:hypothetical protein